MALRIPLHLILAFLILPAALAQKPLAQIELKSLNLSESDLPSVLDYLSIKAREQNGRPGNFVLFDPDGELRSNPPNITISLSSIPLSEAFKYVSKLAGTSYIIDKSVIWVGKPENISALQQRQQTRRSAALRHGAFTRLNGITLPGLDLSNSTLEEAIKNLSLLDRSKGANGNFVFVSDDIFDHSKTPVDLKLSQVSMGEFLQFLVEIGGSRLAITGRDIFTLYPLDSTADNRPKITPSLYRMLATKQVKQVSITEATLPEMIDWFRHFAPEINVVNTSKSSKKISLDLRNVSVAEVLHLTNALTRTEARLGSGNVVEIIDSPKPPPPAPKK